MLKCLFQLIKHDMPILVLWGDTKEKKEKNGPL